MRAWSVSSQVCDTALIMAVGAGETDTVKLLLDRGADLEAKSCVSLETGLLRTGPCSGLAGGPQSVMSVRSLRSGVVSELEWEAALTGSAMGRRCEHGRCLRRSVTRR